MTPREFIERGQKGLNKGFKTGIMHHALEYISRGMYILMGAESGAGKTTLMDFAFLLYPWYYEKKLRGRKIRWIYYSYELGELMKSLNWMTFFMNVEAKKDISMDLLIGKDEKLPENKETKEMLDMAEALLKELMEDIDFVDIPRSAEEFIAEIEEDAKSRGRFDVIEVANKKGVKKKKIVFVPDDPEEFTLVLVDAINLVETDGNLKGEMDAMSRGIFKMRNALGMSYSFVVIQQFNAELAGAERAKANGRNTTANAIKPSRLDFGESKQGYRDADIVFGGVNPEKYDIQNYMGYPIFNDTGIQFGERLIVWHRMKNRWGSGGGSIPFVRNCNAPILTELPKVTRDNSPFNWQKYMTSSFLDIPSPSKKII